jgi:hypothetical protein
MTIKSNQIRYMKKVVLFNFFCLIFMKFGFSQAPSNPINMLRYNDNFNFVKTDSIKVGINKLKHIPLGKHSNISFGGELREQYQYFDNTNFGDIPPTASKQSIGQLWHRVMVHSNIELGKKTRLFVQANSTFRFFNPNPLTPEIDENQLSLHQAFIDYNFNKHLMLRLGRQEVSYGNNRLLTFREGPNTRLSFEAVILKYHSEKRKIDLFAITPVISKPGVFDDQSFKEYVLGVYATETIVPKKLMLDYYFLNFLSESRKYNFKTGKENRQSIGIRAFSQNPKLNYELETTYQFGKFGSETISAFGISTDVHYKLIEKIKLEIGIVANYFTGDQNKSDKQLNTYNLIFSKPSYGLAAPIGSSNIINLNPYLKFSPIKKLSVYTGVYFMERQSNQDGTYSPGMAQLRPLPNILFVSEQKQIGTQLALETTYSLNKNISFAIDGAYFLAGTYIRETGKGNNITYLAAKATFKF